MAISPEAADTVFFGVGTFLMLPETAAAVIEAWILIGMLNRHRNHA